MPHLCKAASIFGLAIVFLIGLTLRLEALDVVVFNEWVARDFDRAFNIVDGIYFPLAGPEVNNGGRLPGPFMYFFLAVPLLIKYSYHSLFEFNFILNVASIAGLFFILKKYFDIYVACIATGIVSISFISILAVAFPINPSFLFPFITIFLWLICEFALKGNTKVIPYIALTFALAVQFHYSIATYFLIPVLTAVALRIKVPLRTILASLIIIAICISPYAIHKSSSFIPSNAGEHMTTAKQDFSSPWVSFKVLTLVHSFHYLSQVSTSRGDTPVPKMFRLAMSLSTGISFYLLLYFVFMKYKDKDWRSCKKETLVLIFLGTPALLYGIVNPMASHFWYGFVFIIPQALLLALFITNIYHQILYTHYKVFYLAVILFLFFLATSSVVLHTRGSLTKTNLKNNTLTQNIAIGSYKYTQLMLGILMDELNLGVDEFYERVYITDYHLLSKLRLRMLDNGPMENNIGKEDDNKSSCFFIHDQNKTYPGPNNQRGRLNGIFFNDKSINIMSSKSLKISQAGLTGTLGIHQYQPVENQSCYNNTFNPFGTTKPIRDLLIAAKDIPFLDEKGVGYKIIHEKIEYGSSNNLKSFIASYAVNNKISQSPFQFNLNVIKTPNGYSIKGAFELLSFFKAPNIDMQTMDVIIETMHNQSANELSRTFNPSGEIHTINILTPRTLANFLNINNTDKFNYNQRWFREVPIAISLKKEKFNVYLRWTLNCGEYSSVWTHSKGTPCPLRPEKDFILPIYYQFQESGFGT